MRNRDFTKQDAEGNYVRAFSTDKGWEVEISCKGKSIKFGASDCNRTYINGRKEAVELVDGIYYKGITTVYNEENKRQFGY